MTVNARFPFHQKLPAPLTPAERQEDFTRSQAWSHRPVAPGLWDGPVPGDKCETWTNARQPAIGVPTLFHQIVAAHPLLISKMHFFGIITATAAIGDVLDIMVNGAQFYRFNSMNSVYDFAVGLWIEPGTVEWWVTAATDQRIYEVGCYCWQHTRHPRGAPLNRPNLG